MANGKARGKVILFGEHFVVHGAPAIAGAIESYAIVDMKKAEKNSIITSHKVVEEYSLNGIGAVLKSMGVEDKYSVHLAGDLPTYGGLGSSAAFCVALARAIASEKNLKLTDAEINRHAYNGEKAFHGNPSGVDNTIATYGGIVEFRRGRTPEENKFESIKTAKPLDIVISFSGKYSATAKMVAAVQKFKEDDREEFQQLVDEYANIAIEGRKKLAAGELLELGALMNSNQELLSDLGVSDEKNEQINETALSEGAFGAKVTGGGGGGCCIALAKDSKHAEKIANRIKKEGFESFSTQIKGI